jgi:hypothetical protein
VTEQAPAKPKVSQMLVDSLCQQPDLNPEQKQRAQLVSDMGQALCEAILSATPRCADQLAAIRKAREAVWTAWAAIGLEDKPAAQRPGPAEAGL